MMHYSENFKHNDLLDRTVMENKSVTDKEMGYNYEIKRIQSFESWPVHYPIDPTRLAKSGFYYKGKADEVTCFSCNGLIKDWQFGDIVQKKHKEFFPNCDFIKKQSNNVPVSCSKISSKQLLVTQNINVNSRNCSVDGNLPPSNKEGGVKYVPNFETMKSEEERLKTFSSKWPLPFISISEVVKAGFFYLGYDDRVQCPFCRGIVRNWENGDVPIVEHAKHFPWCDYLQTVGYANTKTEGLWYKKSGYDICGSTKNDSLNVSPRKCKLIDKNQGANLKKLGVHLYKGPINTQQAPLAARLRSFVSWPSTAPVMMEDLADAGFFYIGLEDRTKCFHCDGGLCNWEKGDDPWVEHARWFPQCDFVRLNKGEEFINSCKENYSTLDQSASGFTDSTTRSVCTSNELFFAKVDAAMKSNLVTDILESNMFPPNLIKQAVERQIKECGTLFKSVDEMCQAVSYLAEMRSQHLEMIDISTQNSDSQPSASHSDTLMEMKLNPSLQNVSIELKQKDDTQELPEDSSLEVENRLLKDQCLCKVCMDNEVGIVFLPCGHLLACTLCAPALKICPMCRSTIQATVRAYLP